MSATKKQIREIRVIDLITYTFLPPVAIALLWFFGVRLSLIYFSELTWVIYTVAAVLTYILVKRFAIGLVVAYKAFAPMKVRSRCRFKPTCSTYMIMAIKKYGLLFGVAKGIRRITRCKPPNGGEDYP